VAPIREGLQISRFAAGLQEYFFPEETVRLRGNPCTYSAPEWNPQVKILDHQI
jgi:hypothetical protein